MDAKPPLGNVRSPGISPSKVKVREDRDKSSVSRIKKLKRRISASFGRLSISKDGGSPHRELERSSDDHLPSTNGHHGLRPSPPVFFSLNGTPDHKPLPHPLHVMPFHMTQSVDETAYCSSNSESRNGAVEDSGGKPTTPVKRHFSTGDMLAATDTPEATPPCLVA
ncbi:hypothetical protein CAPTEDRAFT_212088, partial [Capitella teleta]